jgi:membrane protein DedA with SNARE-associated domain
VAPLLEHFGYGAISLLLIGGGLGLPIPEEAVQLGAGFLAHRGVFELRWAAPAAWLGIVIGDALLFTIASRHGERVLSSRAVSRVLTPKRRERLRHHFANHAFLTIMVARHAGPLRMPTFAMAAAHGVRAGTFLVADALSALVSVPVVVGAGYLFSQHLDQVRRDLRLLELAIVAIVVAVATGMALARRRRGGGDSPER